MEVSDRLLTLHIHASANELVPCTEAMPGKCDAAMNFCKQTALRSSGMRVTSVLDNKHARLLKQMHLACQVCWPRIAQKYTPQPALCLSKAVP